MKGVTIADGVIVASHWSEILPQEWPGRHFKPQEVADKLDGSLRCSIAFLRWMDELRDAVRMRIIVNSWYRTHAHQMQLVAAGKTSSEVSVHEDGEAADLSVFGPHARIIHDAAVARKVQGLGVYQNETTPRAERFIHCDMSTNPAFVRPALWSR